jgi:uncharacterized protein
MGSGRRAGVQIYRLEFHQARHDNQATRNARAAADRFASDSGSRVGSIRQANQGVFTILPADHSSDTGEGGENAYAADSSLMKTVRVVTSVQYYLEK